MTALALPPTIVGALDAEWRILAAPGSWWRGAERIALARLARRARRGEPPSAGEEDLPPVAAEAVAKIAGDVHSLSEDWVERAETQGLTRPAYAEILGVVSRLAAVDALDYAVRAPGVIASQRPLPEPVVGEPSGESDPEARDNGAWVPTRGRPGATTSLTSVPVESDARLALSRALYIGDDEIGNWQVSNELTRPQMELVAARTSLLNDCFY